MNSAGPSQKCLAMVPLRRLRSSDVIDMLADLFIEHSPPEHIRSDNDPEFVANLVRGGWAGSVSPPYRARKPVGERLYREFQRSPALKCTILTVLRRFAPSPAGGTNITSGHAPQQPRISTTGRGNNQGASLATRLGYARLPHELASQANIILTLVPLSKLPRPSLAT